MVAELAAETDVLLLDSPAALGSKSAVLPIVLADRAVVVLQPTVLPRPVALASVVAAPLLVVGALGYTKRRVPWPTVSAMVALALAQFAAWCWVAT